MVRNRLLPVKIMLLSIKLLEGNNGKRPHGLKTYCEFLAKVKILNLRLTFDLELNYKFIGQWVSDLKNLEYSLMWLYDNTDFKYITENCKR